MKKVVYILACFLILFNFAECKAEAPTEQIKPLTAPTEQIAQIEASTEQTETSTSQTEQITKTEPSTSQTAPTETSTSQIALTEASTSQTASTAPIEQITKTETSTAQTASTAPTAPTVSVDASTSQTAPTASTETSTAPTEAPVNIGDTANRGNLLNSFEKVLNGKYEATTHIIRRHTIGVNSPVIQDYDLKYYYCIDDKRETIKHIRCNDKVCDNIMDNINIFVENGVIFFEAEDSFLKQTKNSYKVEDFISEYLTKFNVKVSEPESRKIKDCVFQTLVGRNALKYKVSKLKGSGAKCVDCNYNKNYGVETYKYDSNNRYTVVVQLDDKGWHYKEEDTLTNLVYEFTVSTKSKG